VNKKRRLRLVRDHDPAEVFNDLDSLRIQNAVPPQLHQRRKRTVETFARIPHDRALALYGHRISGAAWVVLIELDRLILRAGGKNPVKFSSPRLRALGLTHRLRAKALRQLETAGVIKMRQRGPGLSPWVAHLWYELRD
jgi:hypothetical protein